MKLREKLHLPLAALLFLRLFINYVTETIILCENYPCHNYAALCSFVDHSDDIVDEDEGEESRGVINEDH